MYINVSFPQQTRAPLTELVSKHGPKGAFQPQELHPGTREELLVLFDSRNQGRNSVLYSGGKQSCLGVYYFGRRGL